MNKKTHLLVSGILLIPIAIGYGFGNQIGGVFSFEVLSIDLQNIFKAIMGFYLAFALFWLYGSYNSDYWKAATISNILFMLGLALGRSFSILFDGIPSEIWIIGTIGELILGFWGVYNWKKHPMTR